MALSTASMATIATAILAGTTAGTLLPLPSPSPHLHMLYYHGAGLSAGSGQKPDGDDNGECSLLGPFSLFVQAALGGLALSSLVYKRWKERPQRPVKVWVFDVSKQVFGSAMLHLANLLMSMFSAGRLEIHKQYRPNPCSFYLLNLGIDTTLGIPILIVILRILNYFATYTPLADPPESIESGNYGHPPRTTWWFKQFLIYFLGLLGMKICVFFLIELMPFIVKIGDWALKWTEGNTAVQIFFVMLLFPVIMNAIQYYIIDAFIKKPLSYSLYAEDEVVDDEIINDGPHGSAVLAGLDEANSTDSDNDEPGKPYGTISQPKTAANALEECEGYLTEDHCPVPPYEPPSSSSSQGGHDANGRVVEQR